MSYNTFDIGTSRCQGNCGNDPVLVRLESSAVGAA